MGCGAQTRTQTGSESRRALTILYRCTLARAGPPAVAQDTARNQLPSGEDLIVAQEAKAVKSGHAILLL